LGLHSETFKAHSLGKNTVTFWPKAGLLNYELSVTDGIDFSTEKNVRNDINLIFRMV